MRPRYPRATVLVSTVVLALLLGCSSTTTGTGAAGTGSGGPSTAGTTGASPDVTATGQASPTPGIVPVSKLGLPDPCLLVTKEEADATIETEFPAGDHIDNSVDLYFGKQRVCTYHPPQVYNGPKLDMEIKFNKSDKVWAAFMADIGQHMGGPAEKVRNLGDRAYLFRHDHDCFVVRGRFLLYINLLYGLREPADVTDRLLGLCAQAIARLPV